MTRFGALLVVLGLCGAASVASPDPKDLIIPAAELTRAKELVRRLGSDDFQEREAASTELAKMGRLARPALAEASAADPNPEVRSRAARLLPRAEAHELKARIDTFRADEDGRFEHDLPAWTAYRTLVGREKPARELYIQMLQEPLDLELLTAIDLGPSEAGKTVADRRMSMYMKLYPGSFNRPAPGVSLPPAQHPTAADVAALMLAEVLVDSRFIPRAPFPFNQQITTSAFVMQSAAMNAINGSNSAVSEPFRKLFIQWLNTRTHPDDLSSYNMINMASNLRSIPETTEMLRRVVTVEGVQPNQKMQALMQLVQRNTTGETEFLRSLVIADTERDSAGGLLPGAAGGGPLQALGADAIRRRFALASTPVQPVWFGNVNGGGNNRAWCQLRDYSLALLLILNKQNLREYGFDFQPGSNTNPTQVTYPNFAFLDEENRTADEKREAAIAKWRAWEADRDAEAGVKPNPFRR